MHSNCLSNMILFPKMMSATAQLWRRVKGIIVIDVMAVSGLVLFLLGSVLIVTEAFRKSKLWGVGCLLLGPLMGVLFTFLNWEKAKMPTAMWICGLVLVLLVFFKQQLGFQSGVSV